MCSGDPSEVRKQQFSVVEECGSGPVAFINLTHQRLTDGGDVREILQVRALRIMH